MMQTFVYTSAVSCFEQFTTQITIESTTCYMCLNVVSNILPNSAGFATNHALKLSYAGLGNKRLNLVIQCAI